jgi:hypothetical protein
MKFSYTTLINQQFITKSTPSKISKDSNDCIITKKINRRQFLKIGTAGMAVLNSLPWLMKPNLAYGIATGLHVTGKMVNVVFKTDKDLVRKMVPHPLKANDEGLMYAFFGRINYTANWAVFGIPASCEIPESGTTREVKGSFFREWYVNSLWSVNYGKNRYGYPRKLADVSYVETQDSIEGSAKHEGKQVARFKFLPLGKKETPLSFNKYERHFNFLSVDGSKRLAITRWADYKEHERESGDVEIELFGIEIYKVIEATYKIAEWVVPIEEPTLFMEIVLK